MSSAYPNWWSQKALLSYMQSAHHLLDDSLDDFVSFIQNEVQFQLKYDPLFKKQWMLRALLQTHKSTLKVWKTKQLQFEKKHQDLFQERFHTQKQIKNAQAALVGIQNALPSQPPEKQSLLREKLSHFEHQLKENQNKAIQLNQHPKWIEYQSLLEQKEAFEKETGIFHLQNSVDQRKTQVGQASQKSGASFETLMLELTKKWMINHCLHRSPQHLISPQIHILTQVRLKSAQAEFDGLIVRLSSNPKQPVKVLAIIEAKKNPNDLAHGFLMRQENIAWFKQDQRGYDPQRYQNQYYPEGHFNRSCIHLDPLTGQEYVFDASSFSYLKRSDEGFFLNRLYFVLYRRPLIGLDSKEWAVLKNKLATSPEYTTLTTQSLSPLYTFLKTFDPPPLRSHDVLKLYSKTSFLARHIFIVPSHLA